MTQLTGFTKLHGLGNDFIVIDARILNLHRDLPGLARQLCDRNRGIGADGLILLFKSQTQDYRWKIFNPDGSEPEMCGNGIRCLGKYIAEKDRKAPGTKMTIETLAGPIGVEIISNTPRVAQVKVDMGEPRLNFDDIPLTRQQEKVVNQPLQVNGESLNITAVSMGNPHVVTFVNDTTTAPVTTLGPKVENFTEVFPKRTNVEFAQVLNRKEINMRVWERGAGETQACGTGACATAVAGVLNDKTDREVTIHLPGGDLKIEWNEFNNHIFMTGPAEISFTGQVEI